MGLQERVWTRERARREGVSRRRLTGGVEFVRVVPGHYLEACWADDLPSRCAAVQVAAPHVVISHWTALALSGLPTPAAGTDASATIHVTAPGASRRPGWTGRAMPTGPEGPSGRAGRAGRAVVVAHRAADLPSYPWNGLRVSGPVRAWCDAAALVPGTRADAGGLGGLGGLIHVGDVGDVGDWADLGDVGDLADLVAAGDVLAARRPTTLRDIGIVLGTRPGGRGVAVARTAAELLDARAESPQESRLRMLLVLAGLAAPAVQHEVRTPSGSFVARVDLAYPAARLAVEYDGDHHRDRRQWRQDLARRERLDAVGWRVLVVTAADLRADTSGVVARVRAALLTRPLSA